MYLLTWREDNTVPFVTATAAPRKTRILISGFPNTGKTTSLQTFIYGSHDYWSPDATEQEAAIKVAGDKQMVILVCPGEFGVRSLPPQTDHITSYYYESTDVTEATTYQWSKAAMTDFDKLWAQVLKNPPDILVVDGIHALWSQMMNVTSEGEYLEGADLNIGDSGKVVQFRAASLHTRTHNMFGQRIASLYTTNIPLIVCTTWEDWQGATTESDRPADVSTRRYLWPAIGGKMATEIVGKFDARLSARLETRCCHCTFDANSKQWKGTCDKSRQSVAHHIWQFLPKNDVMGVGIKGVKRYNDYMIQYPYVHQNWPALQGLIKACS